MLPSAPERNALNEQDAVLLARPIWTDPRVLGAYARQVVRLMRDPGSVSPSLDVASFMADVFERSVPALTPASAQAVACRSGCAYCCAQPVVATAVEIFALAGAARPRAARIAAAAQEVRGRGVQGPWIPCPLLGDDTSCSAYALRPQSCRGYASIDVQDCIKTFVMRETPSTLCPKSYNEVLTACRTVLVAALKICGRPSLLYELNAALSVALADDAAETRWRKGEDVFAGIAAMPVDADQDAAIARFAELVAETI